MSFPKKYPALKVKQPFGEFYITSIPAIDVLDFTFSDELRYNEEKELMGSQRKLDEKNRVKSITDYINGNDTAFPNSIILAANYNESGLIEEDETIRWKLVSAEVNQVKNVDSLEEKLYFIEVPTKLKLAAIVDGQHRVNGFKNATDERKEQLELLVAVYFDLPNPYQAYLFATINYNQKPVDKSLALEQFGYLTQLAGPETWSPELLAVFLAKRFNIEDDSPFFNHIKVAPQNDEFLLTKDPGDIDWLISTATIVDGILKLITTNPKKDSDELRRMETKDKKRILISRKDSGPLRIYYLKGNDLLIYQTIFNFFKACEELIFEPQKGKKTYIKKTIGIQVLFSLLKEILGRNLDDDKNISIDYFKTFIEKIKDLDFNDDFFTASGIGKSRIQNLIFLKLGYKNLENFDEDVRATYKRLAKLK
jgi:DNA phosphorothioation-associated DGQHR protein 1